jgi:hypothetical protein
MVEVDDGVSRRCHLAERADARLLAMMRKEALDGASVRAAADSSSWCSELGNVSGGSPRRCAS